MKHTGAWLLAGWLVWGIPNAGAEDKPETDSPAVHEAEQMAEQVRELGQEMTRVFIQKLQAFFDQELQRMRQISPETRKELEARLQSIEDRLKAHPDDPATHFDLGRVYDRLGDGANAILHMQQAEALYKKLGNAKGLAEARRDLRRYFAHYGFKPEDFDLNRP